MRFNKINRAFQLIFCLALSQSFSQSISYKILTDLPYYENPVNDTYQKERCMLDLYFPEGIQNFPTIVWFHGGGLKRGSKAIPEQLKQKGLAIVAVNYRLHPKVNAPKYIEDAAAAVAWVFKNIGQHGGDTSQIYLCGFSSGGYLSLMVTLDQKWLKEHSIEANQIKGVITLSATTFTNHTIRKEYGMDITQALIDHYAPVHYARGDAPPITLITGDREKEFFGMYEENAYLRRMLNINGHTQNELIEIGGYGHEISEVGIPLILERVND
ncbi:MAG: alpha/beta hydrolase [Bacteroidota bacterium]|nr:alpha/beta hydrolase [Bacteroidota bacterium]MEC8402595.1 alpha/beta hydrolase [Bacteroidota bacterium]